MAVNCCVFPTVTPAFCGVRAIDTRVVTVKPTPLLATPETVTTTFPVVAPLGTVVAIVVAPQLVTGAVVPLKLTVLVPWVDPKFFASGLEMLSLMATSV